MNEDNRHSIDSLKFDYPGLEELIELLYSNYNNLDDVETALNEHYIGEFESEQDFIEQYVDDNEVFSAVPNNLLFYIDMELYTRDRFLDTFDSFIDSNGKVHVFWKW